MSNNVTLLQRVSEFLSLEADLLDHKEYDQWLSLWHSDGLYIVPVDHNAKDFKRVVNVAYDNDEMRRVRINRLQSGEAISTSLSHPTVRTLSRVRLLAKQEQSIIVRCAYCLYENNKNGVRSFPANVTFELEAQNDTFLIKEKVVRLMKSEEYLTTVSYLF